MSAPDNALLQLVLSQALDAGEVNASDAHEIMAVGVLTFHSPPPIPVRCFDWVATLTDYDGAPDAGHQPVGHGATELEAMQDLIVEYMSMV